jgi:hypothetical protein
LAAARKRLLAQSQLEVERRQAEAALPLAEVRALFERDRRQHQSPLMLAVRGIWFPFLDGVPRIRTRDQAEAALIGLRDHQTPEQLAAAVAGARPFAWPKQNLKTLRLRSGVELARAASELKIGEVGSVVLLDYDPARMQSEPLGYAVVQVTEREEPHPLSFEQAERMVRERMFTKAGAGAWTRIRERYLRQARFRLVEANL